jgi:hypothetical protein
MIGKEQGKKPENNPEARAFYVFPHEMQLPAFSFFLSASSLKQGACSQNKERSSEEGAWRGSTSTLDHSDEVRINMFWERSVRGVLRTKSGERYTQPSLSLRTDSPLNRTLEHGCRSAAGILAARNSVFFSPLSEGCAMNTRHQWI